MIKPKSRKHEDRIKALEERVAALTKTVLELDGEFYVSKIGQAEKRLRAKKWWQFWR
jgi:uncharacterized coiled-coil protein SlyX